MLQLWNPLWESEIPSSLLLGGANADSRIVNVGTGLHELSSGLWFVPSGLGSLTKRVNTLGPHPSSPLTVHLKRQPKPSEMLEPHSNAGIILGRLALMWTKAEPTKGPHSCPAGPTAPPVDLVQHQGRCEPLHRARPRLTKATPSENAEPRSPSRGSGVETAYCFDGHCTKEESP